MEIDYDSILDDCVEVASLPDKFIPPKIHKGDIGPIETEFGTTYIVKFDTEPMNHSADSLRCLTISPILESIIPLHGGVVYPQSGEIDLSGISGKFLLSSTNSGICINEEFYEKHPFNLEYAQSQLKVHIINELAERAAAMVIETDEEAKQGLSLALQSRTLCNQVEKTRKEIVRPHIDFQKACLKYAEDFTKKLKKMEISILQKLEAYQQQRKEGLLKFNIQDDSFDELKVDEGTCKTVTEWDYTIEDMEKVPLEYMQINEKFVRGCIKNGIRTIPGLKIFSETKRKYRARAQKDVTNE